MFIKLSIGLKEVGGYDKLMDNFRELGRPNNTEYYSINDATNKSCSEISQYYKNLLRPWDDTDLPWTGMVFGITVSAVWYWCSDQVYSTNQALYVS